MSLELLDCTLRDGTYVNDGAFGFETAKNVICGLNEAGVDIVECGWLSDCNFSINKTYFRQLDDLAPLLPKDKKAKYSLMLYHDRYDLKKIPKRAGNIDIIREIFHKDQYKEAIMRSEVIKESGYELFYQVVNTNIYNNQELMELSGLANKIKPDCIYIVDTNGGMFRSDLKRVFDILNENLDDNIKIGFHSHNNLQLSFSLAIDFIEFAKLKNRNIIVDSTLFGMGRGAGNLNTELICEYLDKFYFKNYNLNIINKLILNEILKFKDLCDWGYSVPYLISGSFNIHSRYAKYLTDKYEIKPEILRGVLSEISGEDKKEFSREKAEAAYRAFSKRGVYEHKKESKQFI